MQTLEGLEVYNLARRFRKEISIMSRSFPAEEKYLLKQQIIRSSKSVTAQIAEGHGRFHDKENIQYCRIARRSLLETQGHINVAFDEGYIEEKEATRLKAYQLDVLKMLNGYIRYLKKKTGT